MVCLIRVRRPAGLILGLCCCLVLIAVSVYPRSLAAKTAGIESPTASVNLDLTQQGMVTSAHPLASAAGLAMLRQGGNAIDATVATTFAISVLEPFSAGIGGGGFLLLRQGKTGEIQALDFREKAPLAANRRLYLDAQGKVRPRASVDGYLAVATPGTVAGLAEVHRRYGRLPWKTVLAPAIHLADEGFPVSWHFVQATQLRQTMLNQNSAAREIFTHAGKPYSPGEQLVQTDLAQTLKAIAQDPESFYKGALARTIAQDMARQGGLITLADLQQYQPTWRSPLCGGFRQYQVCSMPPPSSGGVHLLQMLNLVGTDLTPTSWHQPDSLHLLVEAMRIAYADRSRYLGDPAFTQVPVAALTSPAYARLRRQEIDPHKSRPLEQVKPVDRAVLERFLRRESGETSHLNVVDQDRNAVSLTFTINLNFGAGVVVPGTGIVLNNEMDDFASAPDTPNAFGLVGGEANAIAPGKIPLSSMTPTIVTQNGQLKLVVGAPGGSTIITTVLQVILNTLVYGMDSHRAIAAPRLHHQWLPDRLMVERWGFDPLTLADLQQRGHTLMERSSWGNANAILVTAEGNLEGAADPRGEGAASGF